MSALSLSVPVKLRSEIAMYVLVAMVFPLGWAAGALHGLHTTTRTIRVPAPITSPADVVRALGAPDTSIPGAQVNPQLAGTVCGVYQALRIVLCH